MEYSVKKTQLHNPGISSPEWDKAETGHIVNVSWPGYDEAPETTFKLLHSDEGISILMHSRETNLKADAMLPTDPVCDDSCMEFFLKPDVHDKRYINFECNPRGVMHIGLGTDRYDRILINNMREMLDIETRSDSEGWTAKYYLPYEFLLKFFKTVSPVCRANFYKIAKKPGSRHLGYWSKVETEKADFHVSDFFDRIRFEK